MIDNGGALIPFLDNGNFEVIYENDCFLMACGNVKGDGNLISIGVRWRVSTIRNKNLDGFPITQNFKKCWLIIPNDLAICLLTNIKDREQSGICKIEKDKVYEVLQTIITQEQNRIKNLP